MNYPPIAISQKPFWKAPSRPIFAPGDICTTPLTVKGLYYQVQISDCEYPLG